MPYLHPDPESEHYQDYCKYKLMLHVPFRSVNELKMDFDSWSEASNLEDMTSELIGKNQPKPKSDSAEDEDSQASNHDEVPKWAIL